jgi:hypothetical protein
MLFSIYDCVFSLDYDHPYSFSINIVNHSFLKRGLFLPINKAHVNKLNYYIYTHAHCILNLVLGFIRSRDLYNLRIN